MELADAIRKRRAVRKYTDRAVDDETFQTELPTRASPIFSETGPVNESVPSRTSTTPAAGALYPSIFARHPPGSPRGVRRSL